jgi:hypothetical protein
MSRQRFINPGIQLDDRSDGADVAGRLAISPTIICKGLDTEQCWRNPLGSIPILVFVRCLMLVSIGPTQPNLLGVTLSVNTLFAIRRSQIFMSENQWGNCLPLRS